MDRLIQIPCYFFRCKLTMLNRLLLVSGDLLAPIWSYIYIVIINDLTGGHFFVTHIHTLHHYIYIVIINNPTGGSLFRDTHTHTPPLYIYHQHHHHHDHRHHDNHDDNDHHCDVLWSKSSPALVTHQTAAVQDTLCRSVIFSSSWFPKFFVHYWMMVIIW